MAAHGEQRATLIGRHSYRSPADRPPVERPIRLAVIGLGPRGRGNVVGKALTYAEYELAAVCDRRANLVAVSSHSHCEKAPCLKSGVHENAVEEDARWGGCAGRSPC